jgi:hypothetical protein
MQNSDFYVCRDCHEKKHVSTSVKDASRKRGIMERCKDCDRDRKKAHREDPVTGPAQREKVRVAMQRQRKDRKDAGMSWADSLTEEQLEAKRASARASKRKVAYRQLGVTDEDYFAQLERQDGRCAICGRPEPTQSRERFCWDHDHETGRPRGLLCIPCNLAIAHLSESRETFLAAMAYLEVWAEALPIT